MAVRVQIPIGAHWFITSNENVKRKIVCVRHKREEITLNGVTMQCF